MADGFTVKETLTATPAEVWAYLTDFRNATAWMTGVEDMVQSDPGIPDVGTRFRFRSRGKDRETRVTALDPGKRIALTSTQGGVTATYSYTLAPTSGGTEITLEAVCQAKGLWKLAHPLIVIAMRKSDSSHLAKLKGAMEGAAGQDSPSA